MKGREQPEALPSTIRIVPIATAIVTPRKGLGQIKGTGQRKTAIEIQRKRVELAPDINTKEERQGIVRVIVT